MKRVLSILLVLVTLFSIMPLTVLAIGENKKELIDIDIYKAQCMAGTAVDNTGVLVERCRNIYNYYIAEELFSPTKTFLDEAYANDTLRMNLNEWKVYLGADASTALNQPMKKKDYYESLILALFSQTISEMDDTKLQAAATATAVVDNLCAATNVTTEAALISYFSNSSVSTVKSAIEGAKEGTELTSDALLVIDVVIGASSTIVDAVERITLYNEMLKLDNFTKQWLQQMYNACDSETDQELKEAIYNLKTASISFADSLLIDIRDTSFRTATWMTGATVNTALGVLAGTNPISAAVLGGLKLGKTICDIFYKTSDVYEQFFMLECVYNVEALAKKVVKNSESIFKQNATNENAKSFIYAVTCYFECLIDVEVDCMIKFLDILYNGGIFKGSIVWFYGATDDYQEAVNALESLRDVRRDNYNLMEAYFKGALDFNYPDTYDHYFTEDNTIPITGISFMTSRILPPPYPVGYANMIVGDFANINVQYEPSNTTQKAYTATSDNPQVVTVKDNIMTAVSEGTANITITSVENPNVSYTAEIKVGAKLENTETEGLTNWFKYTVSNGKATITRLVEGYNPVKLTIPSKIQGYPVTTIGEYAFYDCDSLTSVTIGNSVTTIGDRAFYSCDSLRSITIPDSVTTIGKGAFYSCDSLTSITIPDSVTTIGDYAFYCCDGLTNITIPDSVTTIGEGAFYSCDSLTSITIGNSVTTIGERAFSYCSALETIVVDEENTVYHSAGNCLIETATKTLIAGCNNSVIPSDGSVVSIGDSAFASCYNLWSITIPDPVTTIGDSAFYSCDSLTSVTIGNSVTTIGDYAFFRCDSLTSITIPDSVTTIGDSAFSGCYNLTSVTIPDSVTTIGEGAFGGCSALETIVVDDGNAVYHSAGNCIIETAAKTLVVGCKNSVIPADGSVTTIGNSAFEYCSGLTNITIPDSVTTIGEWAFSGCASLTSITIPDSVTTIGDYAFCGCYNLTSITIPDSVTTIGENAFDFCKSLTSITIPDSVTTIGSGAFYSCENLTDIYCEANSKPSGWSGSWKYGCEATVHWGYKPAPLKITTQPESVSVQTGKTAKVTVTATGDGLKYKWYFKNKGDTKFSLTTTFTGNTYSAEMNSTRAGRQLYCVITDKYGNSVKTNTVTIGMPVKITTQPKTVAVQTGKTAKVTVTATGDGLKYKWYFKNKGDTKFSLTTTFTGNTYSAEMNSTRAGRQVYCVITDKYGNSVKTNTVTLNMGSAVKITTQPKTVAVQSGKTAKVTVTATGDGLKYKWYFKNKGASSFSLTTTFTGNTYSATMDSTRAGRQVYCVITDKYGNSVKTNTVTLGMAAKITTQPTSVKVANGKTAKVAVKASGEGLKYKWYYKDKGASKFSLTTTFTGNSYSVTMTNARAGRQVYCVITDKYGNTVKTNTVTLNKK